MFIPSSQSLRPGTLRISYSCSFKSIFYSREINIKQILQRHYLTIIITSIEILPSWHHSQLVQTWYSIRRVSASGLCENWMVFKSGFGIRTAPTSSQSLRLGTLRISYSCSFKSIFYPVLAESPLGDFEHILFMFIQVHILFPSKEYQAYSATALPNNNNHFRWNIAQLTSFTISSNLIYHSQSPEAETLRELIFYSC
jgi:hypothetical protein